jgi:hypothetical protein
MSFHFLALLRIISICAIAILTLLIHVAANVIVLLRKGHDGCLYNIMVGFVCIIKQYQFDFCNLRNTYSASPVSRSSTNSICYASRLYKCMAFLAPPMTHQSSGLVTIDERRSRTVYDITDKIHVATRSY